MKIRTNYHRRDVVYGFELTPQERAEFDYLSEDELSERQFVRYGGNVYDLGDFERTNFHGAPPEFLRWDGYQSDSFFSGILVRYVDENNSAATERRFECQYINVATYCT